MRDAPLFLASLGGTANVSLILKCLKRAVEKFGRHDDGTPTYAARGDLDGFPLRRCDVVALLVSKLGQGHGSHVQSLQLVQIARHEHALNCYSAFSC